MLGVVVAMMVLEGAAARAGECPRMREVEAIVDCQAKVLNKDGIWSVKIKQCQGRWSTAEINACLTDMMSLPPSDGPSAGLQILWALGPPHRCFVLLGRRREGSSESYWVSLIINRHSGFPHSGWALVDTGFTGSLSLPSDVVEFLRANEWLTALDRPGPPNVVVLADGSERIEPTLGPVVNYCTAARKTSRSRSI
jgi:hypothetical protein